MADVVNLRQARKRKQRRERSEEAAANRVRFGRSKPERESADHARRKQDADLDGKKQR